MSPLGYPTKILSNSLFTSWPVKNFRWPPCWLAQKLVANIHRFEYWQQIWPTIKGTSGAESAWLGPIIIVSQSINLGHAKSIVGVFDRDMAHQNMFPVSLEARPKHWDEQIHTIEGTWKCNSFLEDNVATENEMKGFIRFHNLGCNGKWSFLWSW
jgi:hypothetical protein